MRKWWLIVPLSVATGLGVAAYFWFFSGLWMCGHTDGSVESLDTVGAGTTSIVEVDDPTVSVTFDRCTWSATIAGEVNSVLFENAGSAPASVDVQIFGMRADDVSPLTASEPLVISFGYSGSVVAVSNRPDDGEVVWLSAPYVDPAMPDAVAQWVQMVGRSHGA